MGDKKNMCGCNDADSGCGQHCSSSLNKHNLMHMLLCIIMLIFTFWIGLALGELKGYVKYTPLNNGYDVSPSWMMGRNQKSNQTPNAMMEIPNTTASPLSYPINDNK